MMELKFYTDDPVLLAIYRKRSDELSDPRQWGWEKLVIHIVTLELEIAALQHQLDEDQA